MRLKHAQKAKNSTKHKNIPEHTQLGKVIEPYRQMFQSNIFGIELELQRSFYFSLTQQTIMTVKRERN